MTAGLWRNLETTPRQQRHSFRRTRGRLTQADLLLEKLRESRDQSKALELPAILDLRISQFGARLKELRNRGFKIENELDHTGDGVVRSRYWLRFDPEREVSNGQ